MVLRKVGPLSCAKISGVLYAALGLIFGFFFSVISLVAGSLGGSDAGAFGALFGVGAIILAPIFYGVMGFVFGGISAWLYNIIAGFVGGIEVDLDMGPSNPTSQQM